MPPWMRRADSITSTGVDRGGRREMSGSEAIRLRKVTMAAFEVGVPSSMLVVDVDHLGAEATCC